MDHALTYDYPELVEAVLELTGGKGVDLVLDSVAGPDFLRNFDMAAPLGRIVWFGLAGGPPPEFLGAFAKHWVRGIAVQSFHLTYSIAVPYPDLLGSSVGTVLRYLEDGSLKPAIHERLPLRDAAKSHALIQSRTTVGRVVLKP